MADPTMRPDTVANMAIAKSLLSMMLPSKNLGSLTMGIDEVPTGVNLRKTLRTALKACSSSESDMAQEE
eukprot:CAMPEP_0194512552 /NCGR_PEP_ID=MMETSP0253-20130528/44575_1 /TAXON_ID=2966 /ORGANISM="Noctiluca scintillans" /LENGTH=68 /DNA_ID=CAMNT_0039356017 /DNA_START=579 /DNA_END=782 /DNA_ORIENTATION=+